LQRKRKRERVRDRQRDSDPEDSGSIVQEEFITAKKGLQVLIYL